MASNKFKIGQLVEFGAQIAHAAAKSHPRGPFEVTRVLPADDVTSHMYRIKSKAEPFERSVMEYEIAPIE